MMEYLPSMQRVLMLRKIKGTLLANLWKCQPQKQGSTASCRGVHLESQHLGGKGKLISEFGASLI